MESNWDSLLLWVLLLLQTSGDVSCLHTLNTLIYRSFHELRDERREMKLNDQWFDWLMILEITNCVFVSSPVEERVAEGVEFPERLLGVDHQSVAGDDALALSVHHCDEAVGGRLGADPHPGKILLQQIPETNETEKNHQMILFNHSHIIWVFLLCLIAQVKLNVTDLLNTTCDSCTWRVSQELVWQ